MMNNIPYDVVNGRRSKGVVSNCPSFALSLNPFAPSHPFFFSQLWVLGSAVSSPSRIWGEAQPSMILVRLQHERKMLVVSVSIFVSCTMKCIIVLLKNNIRTLLVQINIKLASVTK